MFGTLAQSHEWQLLSPQVLWYLVLGTVILVWTITRAVVAIVTTAARERSRREIAAYIAEGSMTAEQGERLMKAGNDKPAG